MVKLDTQPNLLSYPGFHQLFVCGDFKKEAARLLPALWHPTGGGMTSLFIRRLSI